MRRAGLAAVTLVALLVGGCEGGRAIRANSLGYGGDPETGAALIRSYGCGSCHTIPGIRGADSHVGPPLTRWARRAYIAGSLTNTPLNLRIWIVNPQAIEPGTAMPTLGVTEDQASHIAAYLYTLE